MYCFFLIFARILLLIFHHFTPFSTMIFALISQLITTLIFSTNLSTDFCTNFFHYFLNFTNFPHSDFTSRIQPLNPFFQYPQILTNSRVPRICRGPFMGPTCQVHLVPKSSQKYLTRCCLVWSGPLCIIVIIIHHHPPSTINHHPSSSIDPRPSIEGQ